MTEILTFKHFIEGFEVLKTKFEFRTDALYTNLVYNTLRTKISLEMFNYNLNRLLKQNKKSWQEIYNCKNRPDLAYWIEIFVPKNLTDWYNNELNIITNKLKLVNSYEVSDSSSSGKILSKKKI